MKSKVHKPVIYVALLTLSLNLIGANQVEAAKKIKKPKVSVLTNLKIIERYAVELADGKTVTGKNNPEVTDEYLQEVSDLAPVYAKLFCDGKANAGSEVLIKSGTETLGVSHYRSIITLLEKGKRGPTADGSIYPYWRYSCSLQADFAKVKKVAFYDIYVKGFRKSTEPYSKLVSSKFTLDYGSAKTEICIVGKYDGVPSLTICDYLK